MYVYQFIYLGHILDEYLADDDDDVLREVRNVFVGTNVLCRKFSKHFVNVKIQLSKSYCLCLYGTALWRCYKVGTVNKFKSAYNKCLKIFSYSVTQPLLDIGLPSRNTLIINSQIVLAKSWQNCQNGLASQLCLLCL